MEIVTGATFGLHLVKTLVEHMHFTESAHLPTDFDRGCFTTTSVIN